MPIKPPRLFDHRRHPRKPSNETIQGPHNSLFGGVFFHDIGTELPQKARTVNEGYVD
jgi:hypothetical protein